MEIYSRNCCRRGPPILAANLGGEPLSGGLNRLSALHCLRLLVHVSASGALVNRQFLDRRGAPLASRDPLDHSLHCRQRNAHSVWHRRSSDGKRLTRVPVPGRDHPTTDGYQGRELRAESFKLSQHAGFQKVRPSSIRLGTAGGNDQLRRNL